MCIHIGIWNEATKLGVRVLKKSSAGILLCHASLTNHLFKQSYYTIDFKPVYLLLKESARVLRECSTEIAPILALIYNESLAQGTVPDDWRQAHAHVTPIFKKGRSMTQHVIHWCC